MSSTVVVSDAANISRLLNITGSTRMGVGSGVSSGVGSGVGVSSPVTTGEGKVCGGVHLLLGLADCG